MNNEFWMPMPGGDPADYFAGGFILSSKEQAVLRRLRRAHRQLPGKVPARGIGERAAVRRRRRTLDRLGPGDLRSLVRIVMQLELCPGPRRSART